MIAPSNLYDALHSRFIHFTHQKRWKRGAAPPKMINPNALSPVTNQQNATGNGKLKLSHPSDFHLWIGKLFVPILLVWKKVRRWCVRFCKEFTIKLKTIKQSNSVRPRWCGTLRWLCNSVIKDKHTYKKKYLTRNVMRPRKRKYRPFKLPFYCVCSFVASHKKLYRTRTRAIYFSNLRQLIINCTKCEHFYI